LRQAARIGHKAGCLQCEVCAFDFFETYGEIGKGFAECHHRTPIHTLIEESTITLDQLAIVCSNCHRMLHRSPYLTTEQLRDLLFESETP
ncbi:MAG TPA: HNH endonuclease, partial [Planctomycetaceae bacterium]|nr:HNH endonuclease [Planctomycetaceae bacterium]